MMLMMIRNKQVRLVSVGSGDLSALWAVVGIEAVLAWPR